MKRNSNNNNFNFSRGIIKEVQHLLGINYSATRMRLRLGNPEAIKLASEIELKRKEALQDALNTYKKAKSYNVIY